MYRDFGTVLIFALLGIVLVYVPLLIQKLVAPSQKTPDKLANYECGEEPDGIAWVRFHPRYYVIALLFVLFDVETVFLLPWAINIDTLGTFAIVEMFVFIGILMLGWAYAWRKGALEWH